MKTWQFLTLIGTGGALLLAASYGALQLTYWNNREMVKLATSSGQLELDVANGPSIRDTTIVQFYDTLHIHTEYNSLEKVVKINYKLRSGVP